MDQLRIVLFGYSAPECIVPDENLLKVKHHIIEFSVQYGSSATENRVYLNTMKIYVDGIQRKFQNWDTT